ncbi:hypothetical protein BYT27DRAFT_7094617, partial [Phlegmacium glaucopus]
QNPTSFVDIVTAIEYNRNICISQHIGATRNDVGRGAMYKAALIADNAGNGMYAPLKSMNAGLTACLAPLIHSSNIGIMHKLLCGDRHTCPFKIIPFVNGDDPVHPPPGGVAALLHLMNIGVIFNLKCPLTTSYLNGYQIPVPNLIIDWKFLIQIEIGYTAEF